ncbi:MAG: tetratricopeptide repeat protein, partial [Deltaproteobacteria bacterium]|nr:tetratricopeptide repeat protein [Deltaproteobacteria bacterium]
FDAGVSDDRVFIAMAIVEGTTLAGWCRQRPRSVAEILRMFRAAGRGLCAAHEAGLVHRDFKPSNVLIGHDGVPRVSDFGLAIAAKPTPSPARPGIAAVAGTPAYMAPEQRAGAPVDARADQYAFCVALQQALREAAGAQGRGRVSVRTEAAITRGLHAEPGQRFPTMAALLRALPDPERTRGRARWGVVVLGAGAVGSVLLLAGAGRTPTRCEAGRSAAQQTWGEAASASLHTAFVDTQAPGAHSASQRASGRLAAWVQRWDRSWEQVCGATWAAAEQRARPLDCLSVRRKRFAALVSRLMHPDAALVGRAAVAVGELAPPEECLDPTADAAVPAPRPEQLVEAIRLRDELAEVHGDDLAGRVPQGLARATTLVDQARELGYAPVLAEAQFRLGRLHERAGDYARSRGALEEAYYLAARHGQVRLQADASTMLVTVLGIRLQTPIDAAPWVRHARAAADRLGDRRRQAAVLVARAGMRAQLGEHELARRHYRAALELQQAVYAEGHPSLAATHNNIGIVAASEGNFGVAAQALEQAVAALSDAYGSEHPSVGGALANLGAVQSHLGRTEAAVETLQHALVVLQRRLGDHHPTLAPLLANLGREYIARDDPTAALPLLQRALAIRHQALGLEHPEVAYAHVHLADAMRQLGNPTSAAEHYRRALAILQTAAGGVRWRAGYAEAGLGWVALDGEHPAAAREQFERALATVGDRAPPDDRAQIEDGLARARVAETLVAQLPSTTTRTRASAANR